MKYGKVITCIFITIMAYVIFLVIGQAIPREAVLVNVQKSYENIQKLGLYHSMSEGSGWDGHTEALILNTAATKADGNILQQAMANAYTVMPEASVLENVKYAVSPNEECRISKYSRYWVGIITIYKILLMYMPINAIRNILFFITIVGLILAFNKINSVLNKKFAVAFLISVFLSMYIQNSMCLVFFPDIIVMFAMVYLCGCLSERKSEKQIYYWSFMAVGSFIAYINYWSFPIITLGYPLVFLNCIRIRNKENTRSIIKEDIICSVFWGIGLGGTVLLKQILSLLVLGTQSGTEQLGMRMGNAMNLSERIFSVAKVISDGFFQKSIIIIVVFIVLLIIFTIFSGVVKVENNVFPLILIISYPFIWCMILSGHNVHGFVCYMFGIAIFALLCIVSINCDNDYTVMKFKKNWEQKERKVLFIVLLIFVGIFSLILHKINFYYGEFQNEPWSLSSWDNVKLEKGKEVKQEVFFDLDYPMYYDKISLILLNIENDENGKLKIDIKDGDNTIYSTDYPLHDFVVGDWTDVPLGCILQPCHNYSICYSVIDTDLVPCLVTQELQYAAPANLDFFVDGELQNVKVATHYYYKNVVTKYTKIYVLLFAMLIITGIFNFIYNNKKKIL